MYKNAWAVAVHLKTVYVPLLHVRTCSVLFSPAACWILFMQPIFLPACSLSCISKIASAIFQLGNCIFVSNFDTCWIFSFILALIHSRCFLFLADHQIFCSCLYVICIPADFTSVLFLGNLILFFSFVPSSPWEFLTRLFSQPGERPA